MSKKAKDQQEEKAEEEGTEEGPQVEEEQLEEAKQPEQPKEPEVVQMEEEVPAPEVVEEAAEAPEEEAEAEEGEEEAEEREEEIEVVEERFYTVPFRKAWITPRHKRVPRSMRMLKSFVTRHMKAEKVSISSEVNEFMWSRSIKKPPRKLRIRAVKDKEGRVIVYPAEAAS